MEHSHGYSETFSSNQQKMEVWGKRIKQRYPNNRREKVDYETKQHVEYKSKILEHKGKRAYRWPEWVGNWIMVHEPVGYRKFISVRMRNGTAMSYEKETKWEKYKTKKNNNNSWVGGGRGERDLRISQYYSMNFVMTGNVGWPSTRKQNARHDREGCCLLASAGVVKPTEQFFSIILVLLLCNLRVCLHIYAQDIYIYICVRVYTHTHAYKLLPPY